MNATQLLKDEGQRTQEIIDTLSNQLKELSESQLNWKPSPKKWSILECVEHMNTACRHYIPEIKKQISAASRDAATDEFKPGLLGNYLTNMMQPQSDGKIKGKMKTISKFEPTASALISHEVFGECIQHHKELLGFIQESAKLNLNKVRVTSALGPVIRFKLGDCYRFNTAHHQRHILQAQNVMKAQGFPSH
ncbi:MAG: DinB family protein [Cyclobacteriaceae bacterium]